MSPSTGQAAKAGMMQGAGGVGRLLHRTVQLGLALLIVAGLGAAAIAVRLAQGPVDIAWLARRITRNAITGADVSIGKATLAWQGLQDGMDRPLDLVLSQVDVATPDGVKLLVIDSAAVSLAPKNLLRGMIALTSIDVSGARASVVRDIDGAIRINGMTRSAATPPALAQKDLLDMLGVLDHVRIDAVRIDVADAQLGLAWSLSGIKADIRRGVQDSAAGTASVSVSIGGQTIPVDAEIALLPGGGGLTAKTTAGSFNPAALAALSPALAPLAAADATVRLSGDIALGADFRMRTAKVAVELGAGILHIGDGAMPIRAASLLAEVTPKRLDLSVAKLVLQARDEAQPTIFAGHVVATREAGKVTADIKVDVDQVAFADLPVLWPKGVGGPGTRPWITQNITAGTARRGHVEAVVSAPEDFSDATLVSIAGGIDGEDVTGHWLRPVPPIEHGTVRVMFVDPDTIDVLIANGHQVGGQLMLKPSRVRMTGIAGHDQFIAIQGDLFGPFADLITVLKHPKIHLLDRRPIDLRDPQGSVAGQINADFPLKTDLDIDNVAIRATGRLSGGHLTGIAVGRDIDRALLDFTVNNDTLKIGGTADIATIPAKLAIDMDFRSGGPAQVLEKIGVAASVSATTLAGLGVPVDGVMTGAIDVKLDYFDRRDRSGDLQVTGDLARAAITGGRVPWSKPVGAAGTLDAHVLFKGGKVTGIDRVRAEAPGLSVQLAADTTNGQPNLVRIQRFILGEKTNITGDLRFPERAGQPYVATIIGPSLDVSGEFDRKTQPEVGRAKSRTTPPFRADVKIDQVIMAGGRPLGQVVAHVENDGTLTTNARLSAVVGTGPAVLSLTPAPGGRSLVAEAQDAGALLRTLDVIQTMVGGHLNVSGRYTDTADSQILRGTAEISDFRIRNAPSIGRILQGMSLYGLLELAQGPGLGFTRMVAPFSLAREVLTLNDARAYSASLGITAKGSIDLAHSTANMEGTVVPAYFFNSLLGRVPLIGRLFAPEQGGGVFAATYSVRGRLDDPSVSVNPLAALTPGFLRGFFAIFSESSTDVYKVAPPGVRGSAPPPSGTPSATLTER